MLSQALFSSGLKCIVNERNCYHTVYLVIEEGPTYTKPTGASARCLCVKVSIKFAFKAKLSPGDGHANILLTVKPDR